MAPSDVGLFSIQILSSAPSGVQVHCYDVCMIIQQLSDAVGDAELSKRPIHLKMAMQVRFNSRVIGLGQYFCVQDTLAH